MRGRHRPIVIKRPTGQVVLEPLRDSAKGLCYSVVQLYPVQKQRARVLEPFECRIGSRNLSLAAPYGGGRSHARYDAFTLVTHFLISSSIQFTQ